MVPQRLRNVHIPFQHHGIIGTNGPPLVHIVKIFPGPGKRRPLLAFYSFHAHPFGLKGRFIMGGKILSDDADGIHAVGKQKGGHGRKGNGTSQNAVRPAAGSKDGINSDGSGNEKGQGHGKKEIRFYPAIKNKKAGDMEKTGYFTRTRLKEMGSAGIQASSLCRSLVSG
jgi:hypothetical protein